MKIKLLLILICISAIQPTLAQDYYDYMDIKQKHKNQCELFEGWRGFRISYLPTSIKVRGSSDLNLHGVMGCYVESFGIAKEIPFYIETGIGFSWIGGELDDSKVYLNVYSLNVPINLGFCHHINEMISLSPFAGITLRSNLFGNYSYDGESYNAFDKDEVEDLQIKRFNIGWQFGICASFNNFIISGSYGNDFNNIVADSKIGVPKISVGFNF